MKPVTDREIEVAIMRLYSPICSRGDRETITSHLMIVKGYWRQPNRKAIKAEVRASVEAYVAKWI